MRQVFVVAHRWCGLFTAAFLFVAGLTGTIIAWDHELDALINPELAEARTPRSDEVSAAEVLALANAYETKHPDAIVRYTQLQVPPGHTLSMFVDARSGGEDALGFNNVLLDPSTGEEQGKRQWGEPSLSRAGLIPFIYKLHYSLHLPMAGGIDYGVLLMGIVAIVWMFDCFVALWLSFPNFAQWRRSFAFRWRAGGYRLVFDLHRSGGVWTWLLLLTLAVTAVSMNLREQVVRPVVSTFAALSPDVWSSCRPQPPARGASAITREQALAFAQRAATEGGIHERAGSIFYVSMLGMYGVGFFPGYEDHGDGNLGPSWVYVDDQTGEILSRVVPGTGTPGDLFMQAQFPLHSGRLGSTFGRVLVSLLGLLVAGFSATGIVIWLKKRRARTSARRHVRVARPAVHGAAS